MDTTVQRFRTASLGRYLRPPEAARYVALSSSTLAKLRLSGDGPPYFKAGRCIVYDALDLDDWLSQRRRRSTSDSGEVR